MKCEFCRSKLNPYLLKQVSKMFVMNKETSIFREKIINLITDFEMKDITFNLVILEEEIENGKKVKRAFATNEKYNENDVNLAERLFDLYGKRWGIETSYRIKKHSYLPKTTSKNYLIRLFYFMFSVLLYNLWILAGTHFENYKRNQYECARYESRATT